MYVLSTVKMRFWKVLANAVGFISSVNGCFIYCENDVVLIVSGENLQAHIGFISSVVDVLSTVRMTLYRLSQEGIGKRCRLYFQCE